MPDRRYVRSEVNVVLNGLVASGVIAAFGTTFDPAEQDGAVNVTITPGRSVDAHVALHSVRNALEAFKDRLIITVDAS